MAKTTAPLLSFGGSGQIGKTQVYGTWRGVKYARRYVVPSNPNSTSQQATRGVFKWLTQVWKLLDPAAQTPWFQFAKGKPLTDRNSFIKSNLANLRGTDLAPVTVITAFEASPGVNGGLALASAVSADLTGHHLGITVTPPTLPSGWTYVASHAVALKQQNANTDAFYTSYYDSDASNPGAIDINLGAAMTAVWSAWIEYTKPDGSTAFSPSVSGTQVIA